MNELSKKVKLEEERLGRKLTTGERFNVCRSMPSKDDTASRMEIVLSSTMEGIEAVNNFQAEIESANLVNNTQMRLVASHAFEAAKKDLLAKFNRGELERIKV